MTPGELQRLLDGQEAPEAGGLAYRIAQAVRGLGSKAAGPGDLVALVRQALLGWALGQSAANRLAAMVDVPTANPWPTRDQWRRATLDANDMCDGTWRIQCKPWRPDWLPEADALALEQAILAPVRRAPSTWPADPLVAGLLKFDTFQSAGQRLALRSACLAPAGSTILTVLPTGAGKSLIFQFIALHGWERQGLVLVVVPTVALARDQERRFLELAQRSGRPLPPEQHLAYHGGLSPEERKAIRQAIQDGRQPILFVSPESVLGSLRSALLRAAEQGCVSYFAIDEAHMVTQWGDFRPQFQALAGVRDAMQKRCPVAHPFRTLLLTATLTEECHETLSTLFGAESFSTVAEVALRCEPAYILTRPSDSKLDRVLEALHHLPRPLILYTTKPDDAVELCARIRSECGFQRVDSVVGGDMSTPRGERILDQWTKGRLDMIVATSAFGLGVDQSEVRSILHACIPESMDRWYQEVGRAGRDGRASVALVIPGPEDLAMAYGMANPKLIRGERGWPRWNAMHSSRIRIEGDGLVKRLPLNALAPGYDRSAQRNRLWNLRTLTSMARARMIRFACVPNADPRPTADTNDWAPAILEPTVDIEILDAATLQNAESFETRFRETRNREMGRDSQDYERIKALIEQRRTVHDLLRETYQVPAAEIRIPASAGDCTTSRHQGRARHQAVSGILVSQDPGPGLPLLDPLRGFVEAFGRSEGRPVVCYDPEAWAGWQGQDNWTRLLNRLAASGMVEFHWPEAGYGVLNWAAMAALSPHRYVYAADREALDENATWDVPRVSLLANCHEDHLARLLQMPHRRHLLIVPTGLQHPLMRDHSFDHYADCSLPLLVRRMEHS